MIREIKLRRNIVFSGKIVMMRGEELTDIDIGVRVRKHLIAHGSAIQVEPEKVEPNKVKPGKAAHDKSVSPGANKGVEPADN